MRPQEFPQMYQRLYLIVRLELYIKHLNLNGLHSLICSNWCLQRSHCVC